MKIFPVIVCLLVISSPYLAMCGEAAQLRGINLAGGGFAADKLPGKYGTNYLYPTAPDIAQFSNLGMNVIRLPFLWERLQPALNAPLDSIELKRLDTVVEAAENLKVLTILDPHDFGKYRGKLIGSQDVPTAAFTDFWSRLAKHYRSNQHVVFGLMNEPNEQTAEEWADIAQKAIIAIRNSGAKQLILVPGTFFSGAASWNQKFGKLSNAEALAHLKDKDHNFIIEVHEYFDIDSSGTHPECVSAQIGVERLKAFTTWLHTTNQKGFLGEFGASRDPICVEALRNTLQYLAQNADVWQGWTYWAAAPWFGNYMFNVYSPATIHYPQVDVLRQFLLRAAK